uniref:Uncharacterized protein n=1 Tax=Molossus molossus TaxID=27622 RepID=A0A7J8I9A0_MOLMO|nr:hypothetical protein HJG59_010682 [Molossus molossus]
MSFFGGKRKSIYIHCHNEIPQSRLETTEMYFPGLKARSLKLKCWQGCPNMAQWLSINPCTKRLPVRTPVRAHAQVIGLIPSGGHAEGSQSIISLINVSVSLPLPSFLSKINKEKKKMLARPNL